MNAAVDAVKARGKSDFGAKTLLDVLGPVLRHAASPGASAAGIKSAAAESAHATIAMKALRGRASFLGERSIGHLDPGARSCQILVEAVCDVVEGSA
jgi:dihydroxyacetone kinase-like protein